MKKKKPDMVVCNNRKARHDYHILQTLDAGIVLQGCEVKSLRDKKASLSGSYVIISGREVWLIGSHIDEYKFRMSWGAHEPKRKRKLLLHKAEIRRFAEKAKQKGFTIVPLSIYFRAGKAKVEIAVVQGKKAHDKREDAKQRDAEREIRKFS